MNATAKRKKLSEPKMVFPFGSFDTKKFESQGPLELTREFAEKIVANHEAGALLERHPFVKAEHKGDPQSYGQVKRYFIDKVPEDIKEKYGVEEALFADIDWTETGKERVLNGDFAFLSAEITQYKNPVTGDEVAPVIPALAMTNEPVLSMMPELLCSEQMIPLDAYRLCLSEATDRIELVLPSLNDGQEKGATSTPKQAVQVEMNPEGGNDMEDKIRELLSLSEDEDIEEKLNALVAASKDADEAKTKIEELEVELSDLTSKLSATESEKTDTEKRLEKVETQLTEAAKTATEKAADEFVKTALSDKKAAPAEQDALRSLWLSDSENTEAMIEAREVITFSESKGEVGGDATTPSTLEEHEKLVEKHMSEGMPAEDAFNLADSEVKIEEKDRFIETTIQ